MAERETEVSLVGNCSSTEETLCLLHFINFVSFGQDGCDQEEDAGDEGGTGKSLAIFDSYLVFVNFGPPQHYFGL